MKKYWVIFWHFRKIHLMRLMEFRSNFFFWGGISIMWSIFNVFFFSLLINSTDAIAGWTPAQMYILQAVFAMIDALIWSFFYRNMAEYATNVFDGTLNRHLTRPIDPQFMLMTSDNSYNNIFRFIFGLGMLVWATSLLETPPHFLQILLFIALFLVALTFIYCLWFILTTFSFWVERLSNINEIIPATRRIFQVPAGIYTGIISFILTVAVPLSLVATVPSQVLFGAATLSQVGYLCAYTLALVFFSRWFFIFSIKKYSGMAN